MAAIHVVLFVLTSCCLALCHVITTAGDKTELLDVLKHALRRNNDDYVETTAGTLNITNPYLLVTADTSAGANPGNQTQSDDKSTAKSNQLPDTNSGNAPQRRAFRPHKESWSDESYTNTIRRHGSLESGAKKTNSSGVFATKGPLVFPTVFIPPLRNFSVRATTKKRLLTTHKVQTPTMVLAAQTPKFRTNVEAAIEKRNERIFRFKEFLEKNKEKFDDFLEKKVIGREEEQPKQRAGEATPAQLTEAFDEDGKPALRVTPNNEPNMRAQTPPHLSGDQLDMLPAKGGHVHAMRLKGQLCHRSVLIPEGPKYDSAGRVYLGPYGHRAGRLFRRTPAPVLLLPRCCNCCQKSLLGCE